MNVICYARYRVRTVLFCDSKYFHTLVCLLLLKTYKCLVKSH